MGCYGRLAHICRCWHTRVFLAQNRVLCRGSREGWLLEILSVLRHRKEFQFQECVINLVKAARQYRSWQPV